MTTIQSLYTEEAKILLEGVNKTGLPVVIEGKQGTAPNMLGEYFRETFGYAIVTGVDDFNAKEEQRLIVLYNALSKVNGNKIVVVKQNPSVEFLKNIGNHIKIKTFYNKINGGRYIHIIPSVSVNGNINNLLGEENPMIVVVGEYSKNFESDISKQEGVITIDINSDEELTSFVETVVKGMELSMKHSNKDKFSDVVGAGKIVFKIDLDAVKSEYAFKFLQTISANPARLNIYIQGHTNDYDSIESRFQKLFPKQIF